MAPNLYYSFNAGLMDMYPPRVDHDHFSLAQKWPVMLLLVASAVLVAVVVLLVWGMTKMQPQTPEERIQELPCGAPSARTPLLVSQGKGLRYMQQSCDSLTAGEMLVNADLEWDSFIMQD
ncbi:uncharacterized protein LOC119581282 [Penaeus monodon]|uniref:uncharacterized protein LOC119581282 n=1 Tax=Penaeus monodon TaxID=6687 RepID=UPI0018A774C2|nr:uncharacterized protein LOC119581282 [Penaeus monodon]